MTAIEIPAAGPASRHPISAPEATPTSAQPTMTARAAAIEPPSSAQPGSVRRRKAGG